MSRQLFKQCFSANFYITYLLKAVLKSALWNIRAGITWDLPGFFAFQLKYSLFIKTIGDPITFPPFRRVYDNQFIHKFFVSCERVVYNFAVKREETILSFLLLVFDKGRSLACCKQYDAVTAAKCPGEFLFLC